VSQTPQAVTDELRARLWVRVRPMARKEAGELAQAIDRLAAAPADIDLRSDAISHAHSIAGSAGMYGYPAVARAAAEVEGALRSDGGPAKATDVEALRGLAARIVEGLGVDG
jgi:HPt (histidine-containing phosphotransfer) domain-containing protein